MGLHLGNLSLKGSEKMWEKEEEMFVTSIFFFFCSVKSHLLQGFQKLKIIW